MTGSRRLSQAISEGDGISLIVPVSDLDGARSAEAQGAEGLLVSVALSGIRGATSLPVLWRGVDQPDAGGADAYVLSAEGITDEERQVEARYAQAADLGLECVVDVGDADELETALERLDPEIFLLSPRRADGEEDALAHVLDLLPDVPAGKLAIADLRVTSREEVAELERAGVDGVIAGTPDIAGLISAAPPEV
jgi:indole-3-glycerol phosphate synthase